MSKFLQLGLLGALIATSVQAEYLRDSFRLLWPLDNNISEVSVVEGPYTNVTMMWNAVGTQWILESGPYRFKVAIENTVAMTIEQLVELYAVELGVTQDHPSIAWPAAIASDGISISAYGDTNYHEDLAEFAALYASCLVKGPGPLYKNGELLFEGRSALDEMKRRAPARYVLWETIADENPDPYAPPVVNPGTNRSVVDRDGDGFERVILDGSLTAGGTSSIKSYSWSEKGIVLSELSSPSPVCVPSRYATLTGNYPSCAINQWMEDLFKMHGHTFVHQEPNVVPETLTIAKDLKKLGYATGAVGKNHVIEAPRYQKVDARESLRDPVVLQRLKDNQEAVRKAYHDAGFDFAERFHHSNPRVIGPPEIQGHNLEWLSEGTLEFIDENHQDPFFLFYAVSPPHVPNNSWKGDPRATPLGILDKAPEGGKTTCYQGGMRSFGFVWGKGIQGGRFETGRYSLVDLAPTLVDLAGGTADKGRYDGISLKDNWVEEAPIGDRVIFGEMGHSRAVLNGEWKNLAGNPEYAEVLKEMRAELIIQLTDKPGPFAEFKPRTEPEPSMQERIKVGRKQMETVFH